MTRSFGERLRDRRSAKGFSQRGLAAAARTTQARISLYETDGQVPDLELQKRLAIVLDAPDLIEDDEVRSWYEAAHRKRRRRAS